MKYLKIICLFAVVSTTAILFSSCNNNSKSSTKTEQATPQGKEYTAAYVCPMHCKDSGSDKPGNCPVCGMKYVKNKDHKQGGKMHDDHEGHNH